MSAKTKIVILHRKELAFAGILALLILFVLVVVLILFVPPNTQTSSEPPSEELEEVANYTPGVYNSTLMLGNIPVDIQVTLDENHINSIEMIHLSEDMETMYPLMQPALDALSEQIITTQSLEGLTYSDGNQYTCSILLGAIAQAIEKGKL